MTQPPSSALGLDSTPTPPRDACLAALARVIASESFGKSQRLSSFLRYVCTTAVDGQASVLCEQHIGVAVFGRPDHYNPADDTIVRTTARLLRQRLAQYYETEGRTDDIRIAIPRGSYVPVFAPATDGPSPSTDDTPAPQAAPAPASPAACSPAPTRPAWRPKRRLALVAALLMGLAASVATWHWFLGGPATARASFWATLLPADRDALLIVADTGLVLFQLETRTEVGLEDYSAKRVGEQLPSAEPAARFRSRRYTGMSSVQLAAELGRQAVAAPGRLQVRFARDTQLSDLKRANVILLGVAQANPWAALYRSQLDFHIDWDRERPDTFLIRNDRPGPGEQPSYQFRADDPQRLGFATIAFTRGLGGAGHALLVGGTTSAGTDAAIELLADVQRLTPLLRRAQRADGSIGDFEVLLQCVLQANGSTDIKLLAFHAHDP